ncbi:MAG: acylphosphatase [Halobacteriota archaeon]
MKAKKIIIKGKVHGVGYRLFLMSEAETLFIENFDARNVVVDDEQRLVALIGGPEEKIKGFTDFVQSNYPPDASVLAVEVEDYTEKVRSIESFRQSFMVSQTAKLAQAGVGMLGKQDMVLGKLDMMLGNQDAMLGNQDAMLEKKDRMLEKQDETINVIREESEKTREVIEGRLEEDVEWLKVESSEIKTSLDKVKAKVGMV